MTNKELLTPTKIIKSKRKSISLIIKDNGDFIIRAPLFTQDRDIKKFIHQKESWIIKKRYEQQSNTIKPLCFNGEEQIMLLGKMHKLTYNYVQKVKILDDNIVIPIENSKEKLISYLKKFSKTYINERVKIIANLFNFNYNSISISSARTCWGSCSFSNKLHFTYKLIMCPQDVIDYIVLHELCHTKVKNHSSAFWELVKSCNPNYKALEKWLKKNRAIINLI